MGRWTEEELAKFLAPEEWADKRPGDGPHYTVVGAPEDCAKWIELALPWRIASTGNELRTLADPRWVRLPREAAERWARRRWEERWDCEGPVPLTMRALVTHTDGRQWRVNVEITRVIDFYGHATLVDPAEPSNADKLPGGAA